MELINTLVLVASIINLVLTIFLITHSGRSLSTRYFSFVALFITAWCFSMIFHRVVVDENYNDIIARILYFTGGVTGPLFLLFAYCFPEQNINKKLNAIVISSLFLLAFIIFYDNLFLKEVNVIEPGYKEMIYGPLYYAFYNIYLPSSFLIGNFVLMRKLKKYKGLIRVQILFIIFGTGLASGVALITNLLLPTLGYFRIDWFGQIFTIVWIASVMYAILRYSLFDTRVLLGRIVYIIVMSILPYGFFYLVVFVNENLFGGIFTISGLLVGIIESFVFIVLYDKTNKFIREQINSTIINPRFEPEEVLNKLNQNLSKQLDSESIINETLEVLGRTIRSRYEGIFVMNKDRDFGAFSLKDKELNLSPILGVFNYWSKYQPRNIVIDEYELVQQSSLDSSNSSEMQVIIKAMQGLSIGALIPFKYSKEEFGVILLGQRDGTTSYIKSEIEFVSSVSDILGVALGRSLLFTEVQLFNETLQDKVDAATNELKNTNAQLAEALRKEKDMMDILGHELRTPLGTARNAIMMMDTMRKSETQDQEKTDKYMKIAVDNIRREKDMLEVILQSARLENSRLQINFTKISIDEVLENALTSFQGQAEKKKLELKIENNAQGIYIKADQTGIQQTVDNFTSNSVKYTEKGSVTIFAETIDDGHVRIGVKDTGEGISEKDLPNIGKKFYRANPYLQSAGKIGDEEIVRPGGTGIGMYVVKGLLEAMGSKLEIQSTVGQGSVFSAVFEIVDPNSAEISSQKQEKPLG